MNEIKSLDIDRITPMNGLLKLFEIKNRILNIEKKYIK